MAGMLDELLQGNPQMLAGLATMQPWEQGRPTELDYSQGFPMPYLGKKKSPEEQQDDELKAFQARNPTPPPPMAAQAPIPGLLGPNIAGPGGMPSPGTMPQLAGGAAPPLPPPTEVPPLNVASVPNAPPPAPGPPSTDISAQSVAPGGAPAQPSLLDRIGNGINRNSSLLLSMGAGFAGAPSFGTGMSRAFGNAVQGGQIDAKNNQQATQIQTIYAALLKAGVPKHLALAATQNPEILKQVTADYVTSRKSEIKTIKTKDQWGNETERLVSVNPYDNTSKEITGAGGAKDGGITAGGTTGGAFAPGVTSETFNHGAIGEDYIKQFSPEAQAAIKDYLGGRTTQTGRQMPIQMLKMAAQKYGSDIGMPADDAAINQRKLFSNSLADTKSGIGMQSKGFEQGLEHALSLSNNLVKLGNVNGLGFEPAANWANWAKNMTGGQTAVKKAIQADSQTLAGEVGKLYSGGQGGGVHERQATTQNLGQLDSSPVAAAGGLEATIELMEGGLRTLENRRDQLFPGGGAPKGSDFRNARTEEVMSKIRKNIAILKGEQQAEAAAPAAPSLPNKSKLGIPWGVVQ